jgi:hypothetical protein
MIIAAFPLSGSGTSFNAKILAQSPIYFFGIGCDKHRTVIFFYPVQKKNLPYGSFYLSRDFIVPEKVQNEPQRMHPSLHGSGWMEIFERGIRP